MPSRCSWPMDEISRQNEAEGLPHLEMGAAVNTGLVVVGKSARKNEPNMALWGRK